MEHSFPNEPAVLAVVIGSLNTAFRNTLVALALAHNNTQGPWLDELENGITETIKSTVGEGVAIETEATAIAAGLAIVEKTFAELRDELSPGR